jgi:hypothetical protein
MAPFLYSSYREQNRTLRDIGVWNIKPSSVTGLAEPEQIDVLLVTGAILPLLGISPALGRWFSARDDSPGTRETGRTDVRILAIPIRRRPFGNRTRALSPAACGWRWEPSEWCC